MIMGLALISTVLVSRSQRARRMTQSFVTDRVGHRIGFHRNERLDQLGQRIQPSAGCDRRWQAEGQFGIDQCQAW